MATASRIYTPQSAPYMFSRSREAYRGPDPVRVKDQLQLLQNLWREYGVKEFVFRFCWILRKPRKEGEDSVLPSESQYWNRNLVPFLFNNIQTNIEDNLGQKNIFLKPRQAGYTTYSIVRRLFLPCILNPGENGLLISRNSKTAGDSFLMLRRAFQHFACVDPYDRSKNTFATELKQHLLHIRLSNRRELLFDAIDTAIRCDSAEVEEVGQSYTYTHVVADEVARWEGNPEATLANLKEAIPGNGTLDLVSTANGYGGYFFEECMRAKDTGKGYREFKYHFHQWWWHEEYRDKNPVDEKTLTKQEHRLIMAYGLDLYQINWRRKKVEELRHEFEEKYPEDDITCFLMTGQQYFDKEILKERYVELKGYEPREKYTKLQIFKKEKPHHQYIIGADVAEGLEAGNDNYDWSAAVVIDRETGEQVAAYRSQLIPEEYAWDLADLGHRYNDALIAVERNEDGGAVILTLEVACMYMNLYKHRDWWKKDWKRRQRSGKHSTGGEGLGQGMREILGFPTTKKTRPIALNRIRYFVSEHPELIHDIVFLQEALTFVRNKDKQGRPEAGEGCHDDTVMCNAVAQYVRAVSLGYLVPEALPHREKYGDIPQEFLPDEDVPVD